MPLVRRFIRKNRYYFILCIVLIVSAMPMFVGAQSDTIEIDTGAIFTQTNSWITTLMPIFGISIGVTLAIAVMVGLTKMLQKAFSSLGGG